VASRRYRSKLTLNSNLSNINSKINELSKRPEVRRIANESITGSSIRESSIVSQNIADDTITGDKIAAAAILATNIASQAITLDKIDINIFTDPTFIGSVNTPLLNLESPAAPGIPIGRINGIYYPFGVSAGSVSLTGIGTASVSVPVVFGDGDLFLASVFSEIPIVTVTCTTSSVLLASVSAVTNLGMTITLRHVDNTTFTSTHTVNYIAIQMQ
jgi:hypothetical protein